ncbi:hypothetical protein N7456_008697 [Penicillium angulare]|uniref:Uncharacterized protein n=1 Tax=Penicillium angulare TaxID=116970 RepID=A0A9W9K509_9EURO|nr:hypothetical protein N7456_008697 [Penicillium angulare]
MKHWSLNFLLSCLVTLFTAILVGLAIYVNVARPVVGKVSTPGFSAIDINTSQWNIACAVLGTAVGMLVTAALACDDGLLTRQEIVSKEGVPPFYLRPLTIMRGLDQVKYGWPHISRMILLCLTIVATLFTTATVAIFGVHNVGQSLSNQSASWPLDTILKYENDGLYSSPEQLVQIYEVAVLDAFLFRTANIHALNVSKDYVTGFPEWLPELGQIGDTLYPSLNTQGIGLNISSYLDYTGHPREGFQVPDVYTFNKMYGNVFGTQIEVKCTDAEHTLKTSLATTNLNTTDSFSYLINTQKGAEFTFIADLHILKIGAALVSDNNEPVLTIAIPYDAHHAFVTECTYSGNDFTASVSLDSRVSPLRISNKIEDGSSIDNETKWLLARSMYNLLSLQAGGSLTRAWQSAKFLGPIDGHSNATTTSLLESIFGQMGEALISLKRQDIEKADLSLAYKLPTGSAITVFVTVSQIGAGS